MNTGVETVSRTTTLLPFRDGRLPEMFGSFQLDDHSVEEWSDSTDPSFKHLGRKEIGKWVDSERKADIQFQRHEDSKKFSKGEDNQRTEIIQGTAPDSKFQIVRTERQFNESGQDDLRSSRISSMSTSSYQMSTTRGIVGSTSKTTSNKTSTKIVTVSGRTERLGDDFENLKIPFHPLDTSTQRERINMSRSGTMGVRRPPTRKQHGSHLEIVKDESHLSSESTDETTKTGNESEEQLSILSYKNISPKIRIGFPTEIQLELRTKLRGKDLEVERDTKVENIANGVDSKSYGSLTSSTILKPTNLMDPILHEYITDELGIHSNQQISPDYSQTNQTINTKLKSYRELFDDPSTHQLNNSSVSHTPSILLPSTSSTLLNSNYGPTKTFLGEKDNVLYNDNFMSPLALSRSSWDLMERLETEEKPVTDEQFTFTKQHNLLPSSTGVIDLSTYNVNEPFELNKLKGISEYGDDYGESSLNDYVLESFEDTSRRIISPPIHSLVDPNPSPPSERSRKLMKLFDNENEDNFPNTLIGSKLSNWESEWEKTKNQLDLLNESLDSCDKKILDEELETNKTQLLSSKLKTPNNFYPFTSRSYLDEEQKRSEFNGMSIFSNSAESLGKYSNPLDIENPNNTNSNTSKQTQVSQTWISSIDIRKPSRHAQDQDLSTSISATSDPMKKSLKKVEFCKTEVHFTPEPGRFHIVESDENKPSTVHLFRRRKRKNSIDEEYEEIEEGFKFQQSELLDSVDPGRSNDIKSLDKYPLLQEISNSVGFSNVKERNYSIFESPIDHRHQQNEQTEESPITPLLTPSLLISELNELIGLQEAGSDEKGFSLNELGDMEFEEEPQFLPPVIIPTTSKNNYEELKIQKYLKQLKPSIGSISSSESINNELNYTHDDDDYITNQVRRVDNDQVDDDEDVHFRYGSFVPLATRRSLIEMNNRNRMKRTNCTTNSHVSDNSSTISNYSLPHSDNSRENYTKPLTLTVMQATVATDGSKPRITSVELRYSLDDQKQRENDQETSHSVHNDYDERRRNYSQIPSPLLPIDLTTMSPYRTGHHRSFSSSPNRTPSPSNRDNLSFKNSKPPTPILPIQFTNFEKTGEALRERFLSKTNNSQCPCKTKKGNSSIDDLFSYQHTSEHGMRGTEIIKPVFGFKSVVLDKNDEDENSIEIEEPLRNDSSPLNSVVSHQPRGTSIVRSMTFPKTNRVEPEWVSKARAKAKNRESWGTDWTLIGQRYSSNRESEPPWISELRIKNRQSSGVDELNYLHKSSIIYPWQKDNVEVDEKILEIGIISKPSSSSQKHPDLIDEKARQYKSLSVISTSATNNKSIVDLNRDYDSILINPNQIELNSNPLVSDDRIKSRKTTLISKEIDKTTSHRINSQRINKIDTESKLTSTDPTTLRTTHHRSQRGMENGNNPIRKPLHTSTSANQTEEPEIFKEQEHHRNIGNKPKTPPKPPKPPQRISSLVKSQTIPFNGNVEKKKKSTPISRKIINHTNNTETIESSSVSNPPSIVLHRHPTIKISKLPFRASGTITPTTSSKSVSPDCKDSFKTKTKPNVSLINEARRLYKGKSIETCGATLQKSDVREVTQSPKPLQRTPLTVCASPQQKKR